LRREHINDVAQDSLQRSFVAELIEKVARFFEQSSLEFLSHNEAGGSDVVLLDPVGDPILHLSFTNQPGNPD
jgi:hypothetical protein